MKYANLPFIAECPICLHTKNTLLYRVASNEAARHFLVAHNQNNDQFVKIEHKITRLWKKKSAAIVVCKNCNFTFADPFIAGDHEFYNLLPHSTAESPENWKWEFDQTYKKIEALASGKNNLTLLEIGASTGDFIKRIGGIIPLKNILCLEYSEIGVASIKKAGIEAYSWHFQELPEKLGPEKKFDVICLFQVLEHLDNVDQTFKAFNAIAKPGSHLFIGVPNGRKTRFNELNNALLDMPPNHIGRYNRKVFEFLGKKYGWETDELLTEPFTPLDVVKTVMYYQSLKRAQFQPVKRTAWYRVKRYLEIKWLRLQAEFLHRNLGDTLWVHYIKH